MTPHLTSYLTYRQQIGEMMAHLWDSLTCPRRIHSGRHEPARLEPTRPDQQANLARSTRGCGPCGQARSGCPSDCGKARSGFPRGLWAGVGRRRAAVHACPHPPADAARSTAGRGIPHRWCAHRGSHRRSHRLTVPDLWRPPRPAHSLSRPDALQWSMAGRRPAMDPKTPQAARRPPVDRKSVV